MSAGHHIALALDNRADFFVVFAALNGLDACAIPLNMELAPGEIAHVISHSDVAMIISLPQHTDRLLKSLDAVALSVPITTFSYDTFRPSKLLASPNATSAAAIVYTSGTTSAPKGCLLSDAYFILAGTWYRDIGGFLELTPGHERLLTPLPTSHVNALAFSFMAMLTTGGCLIQLDRFHPSTWWSTVRDSRATAIHYLGVMPALLLSLQNRPDEDFRGQVKFGYGGGVEPDDHREFETRFGFPLVEGWAMTETGAGGCIMVTTEPRHVGTRCIGRAAPGVDFRIIDEDGNELTSESPGELLVRAPGQNPASGFFSGYYKDAVATEEVWRNGWLHTGDIVTQGVDGSLFFVDRKKNIVRRSGENIGIFSVESVLQKHPAIDVVAVAPVPDDVRGEEVFALVVLSSGFISDHHTADTIFRYCLDRLAYFKAPGYIAFVDKIPTTTTQKVRRTTSRALAAEILETGNAFDFRASKRKQI